MLDNLLVTFLVSGVIESDNRGLECGRHCLGFWSRVFRWHGRGFWRCGLWRRGESVIVQHITQSGPRIDCCPVFRPCLSAPLGRHVLRIKQRVHFRRTGQATGEAMQHRLEGHAVVPLRPGAAALPCAGDGSADLIHFGAAHHFHNQFAAGQFGEGIHQAEFTPVFKRRAVLQMFVALIHPVIELVGGIHRLADDIGDLPGLTGTLEHTIDHRHVNHSVFVLPCAAVFGLANNQCGFPSIRHQAIGRAFL